MAETIVKTSNRDSKHNIRDHLTTYAMVIALIVICVIFQILTKGTFFSFRNLSNLFRQTTIIGILSIGMSFCIISGNFDLSVGSVVGVSCAIVAVGQTFWNLPMFVAILVALSVGLLIGLWQGYWVAYRKVPAFIVTLGGMMIFRGVTLWITKGNAIPISNPVFLYIGQHYLYKIIGWIAAAVLAIALIYLDLVNRRARNKYGFVVSSWKIAILKYILILGLIFLFIFLMNAYEGIPIAVVILLVLFGIFNFVLNNTSFGRYVYAVGGNSNASKLSGINIPKNILTIFILMGLLSAVAGIILASRLASATPLAGNSYELYTIASCVIGGISLSGGRGRLMGAIVGALLISSLNNGMSLLNLTSSIQYMITGMILLLAVWFDIANTSRTND